MRTLLTMAAWFTLSAVLLVLLLSPQLGVLMANPPTALSLGLVGLGMMRHARHHAAATPQPVAAADTPAA